MSWIFNAFIHWIGYWLDLGIVAGIGVLGFVYSPFFKQVFVGIVIGSISLTTLQYGLVHFKPTQPQICQHPTTDPNGPTVPQCFHKTDDRGFGYWGACDGQ